MPAKGLIGVLLLVLAVSGGPAAAQEEVEVTEAEAAAAKPLADDMPDAELTLTYEEYLENPNRTTIQEAISADVIDLNELREAIQAQASFEQLRLSLEECVQIALRRNPDIEISGIEPLRADSDVMAAKGEFDAMWQTTANYLRSSVTASQQFEFFGGISSIESYTTTIDSTVGGKLHTGTQYALAYNLVKDENTYGGFIEEFEGRLGLTLTQPLLRGFGLKVNKVHITMAKNARAMGIEQFRLQVMNTVAEVAKAYWDLVGAIENVKVQRESLANAERLLKINETRREIGTAADIDVAQSKAGVATRQGELISARARVSDAGDRLKLLLDLQEGDYFSKASIVPTSRPSAKDSPIAPTEADAVMDISVQQALEHRPEVEISDLQIENAELDAMKARNEMLPEFNITGMYAQGGRNHKLRQMLYGIKGGDHFFYSYGFEATVPIGNRTARGNYQRKKLTVREMELRKHQTLQSLMMNVHMAVRNVLTNQILVESNRQARKLQEANVTAEMKRLRLGVTTSWQVLQVQEDLTAAQTLEVQAQTAHEKALVDLELARGTLLDEMGIEPVLPEAEPPPSYLDSFRPRWK